MSKSEAKKGNLFMHAQRVSEGMFPPEKEFCKMKVQLKPFGASFYTIYIIALNKKGPNSICKILNVTPARCPLTLYKTTDKACMTMHDEVSIESVVAY